MSAPLLPQPPYTHPSRGLTGDIWGALTDSYLNVLLLAVPLAVAAEAMHATATTVFGLSFVSLVPLAAMLGTFTEDLALRSNEVPGGTKQVGGSLHHWWYWGSA